MSARLRTRIGTFVRKYTGAPGLSFFPTFDNADRASTGYDDEAIASVVADKTIVLQHGLESPTYRLAHESMQDMVALSLAARDHHGLSVVEFGGACGASFLVADRFLPELVANWTIIETPAMTRQARAVFETDRLRFYSDLNDPEIDDVDLLMAAGSLQCADDPGARLRALIERFAPRGVYVSRTPLVDGPTMFARSSTKVSDHGPGQASLPNGTLRSVPLTILSEKELYSILDEDYEIEILFPVSGPPYPQLRFPIRDHAFFARRKP